MLKPLRWLAVALVAVLPLTLLATSTEPSASHPGHSQALKGVKPQKPFQIQGLTVPALPNAPLLTGGYSIVRQTPRFDAG